MSKNPIKVMSGMLTGRIYAGRVNPKSQMFIGEKVDVTDTAVDAVAQLLLKEEICLQFEVRGKTYRLEVVEVQEQAVPEIQQSKQAEIDDLKAQLKALHDSRIEFVEYCRKMESDAFVVVKKEDIENWYLDENEHVWYEKDSIDGYLDDIDNGEVLEVQRKEYVVINSNPVFATNVFTDFDNIAWELFDNRDDAEKAAAHCKAMLEAAKGTLKND